MREADIDGMGISIGGRNLTNLRYADDTALNADNITNMKRILNRVDIAGRKASLKLNAKKTKVMHIIDTNNTANDIKVDNSKLEYVQCFKYLGPMKENNGSCSKDVRTKIGMAKQETIELNNIWKDNGIPTTLKMAILWTLKQEEQNRIHAIEMWLYRRLLRVSWKEKRTNDPKVFREKLALLNFLRNVAISLVALSKPPRMGRPLGSPCPSPVPTKKRCKAAWSVNSAVRLEQVGLHYVMYSEDRGDVEPSGTPFEPSGETITNLPPTVSTPETVNLPIGASDSEYQANRPLKRLQQQLKEDVIAPNSGDRRPRIRRMSYCDI
ncbi:hypothetical protein EGW08_010545 [Elysia chlorotica]|uniref:Reverse transcriptase domain-containing protein n=1 Tax=Elysia chlorotica TaxID=188477 RepID=A0A3S1BIP2_ELYCH|nr:hypothetical protein EGW08_010545 [Elysia chlorotica]